MISRLSRSGFTIGDPWLQVYDFLLFKKIVARDASVESVASRATQRSQYLCVRDNVSLFLSTSRRSCTASTARGRTVDLRSDCPAWGI